jgi:hypothetical protein
LRRDRAFTLTAIATLTLAIALNVTVFAVMDTMLFRGMPLARRSDRLVSIQERRAAGGGLISYADFEDWRAEAKSFEGLAFVGESFFSFKDGDGRPTDTSAFALSANTFGLLGVRPMLGRDFAPADEFPGAPMVAILNHRFWVSRFGSRADIVGMRVHMNGSPTLSASCPNAVFPRNGPVDSARADRGFSAGGPFRRIPCGRALRDGVSANRHARNSKPLIALEAAYPTTNRGCPDHVHSCRGKQRRGSSIIWGSVAAAWLVFLIACANLMNPLARSIGRAWYSDRWARARKNDPSGPVRKRDDCGRGGRRQVAKWCASTSGTRRPHVSGPRLPWICARSRTWRRSRWAPRFCFLSRREW